MKLTNIYNYRNHSYDYKLKDNKFSNAEIHEYMFFRNAFEIVKTKFLNNDPYCEYSDYYVDYDEELYNIYRENIKDRDKNKNIELSNAMANEYSKIICKEKDIRLKTKNNIKSFLELAFKKNSNVSTDKSQYITCRIFCKDNNLVEHKFKSILIRQGYFNGEFKFMPSRLAIDNKKVLIDNYFMPNKEMTTNYKLIDTTRRGNFFILWEYQFLRNMMIKYYKKCEKDEKTYQKRYRRPSCYNMLTRRLKELVEIFSSYPLSYYGQYVDKKGNEDEFFNKIAIEDEATMLYIATLHESLNGRYLKYDSIKNKIDNILNLINYNINKNKIKDDVKLKEIKIYLSHFEKYCIFYKKNFN